MQALLEAREARVALALAIGLLLGVERERRKRERAHGSIAGLRTFALTGLLGGLAAYLALPYAIVAGALIVGALIVAGYALDSDREKDKGLTTEIALLLTYVLGALALEQPEVAGVAAIITAFLLRLRNTLHRFVGEVLTEDELHDGLLFLVFAFVALPLAPDRDLGPYAAINPQALARLMLIVALISAGGYVAQRLWGARLGLVASGLASGFISSTATIAVLGNRAKSDASIVRAAAAGGVASCIATVVQYAIIVATIDRTLLVRLAPPLGSALLAACVMTALYARSARVAVDPADAPKGRAFQLVPVLVIGAGSALVAVLAAALSERMGSSGIVLVSSVAGLVDAHATSGSIATLHHSGRLDGAIAVTALVAALTSNSLTKLGMATAAGPRPYALRVASGVVVIAAAAWAGLLFQPLG